MRKLTTLLRIITLIVGSGVSQAEERPFRIKLTISAPAETQKILTSYFGREFRSLKDVSIVESDHSYQVTILAMQTANREGTPTGWVFSCVTDRPLPYKAIRDFYGEKATKGEVDAIALLKGTTVIVSHFVCIGGDDELEKLSKNIVANIDGGVLEEARSARQQVQDFNDAQRKEKLEQ